MFALGISQFYVADLSPHWQSIAKDLDPDVETVWVVFYKGVVFGVYLTVTAAAKAVVAIELDIVAGREPQPQCAIKVEVDRRLKVAQAKRLDDPSSTLK